MSDGAYGLTYSFDGDSVQIEIFNFDTNQRKIIKRRDEIQSRRDARTDRVLEL